MNRKPSRVFYGWWVVGAAVFIGLYVAGVVFYGFTAIFEPIANDLGWSYTQISLAASLRGLEAGLLAPVIGILVDRWGPRRLIFSGAIIVAIGLTMLSHTTTLAMFYGAFAIIAIGTSCCTMTVLMTAVANWFHRRIGIATGIAVSGFGLGGLLIPVIVRLIEIYEWRGALTIMALGLVVTVLPLSFLFRHKPEHYGYLPDGQIAIPVTTDNGSSTLPPIEVNFKVRDVLKSGTFWRMALAFTYHVLATSTAITHVMPYLSSIGLARSTSSLVATAAPLASIGGRIGLGWLGDKLDRRLVSAGSFALIGLGLLCFGLSPITSAWLLLPFALFFGIGYGGGNVMRASLSREHFGRTNFGAIFGLIIGLNMIGGIIGPPLAGWVYDTWGSYQGIWFVFAGLSVPTIISVLTIPAAKQNPR